MEKILRLIEKIIPKSLYRLLQPIYHYKIAFLAALFYGFPSRKMIVIGVTGTKGKTTTSNLIAQILNSSGHKTGMATTANFRISDKEWVNETKQTMLGRFRLQKLLRQMVKEKCEYAVIETSSEGILQYRHRFIDYSIGVFTNITPEHLERHGGFENYRAAKVKLFEKIAKKSDSVGIFNLDDKNVSYFLEPDIKTKYGYGIKFLISNFQFLNKLRISNIKLSSNKTEFDFGNEHFEMSLIGEFNVYNAAAAICVALSQNIPVEQIKTGLKNAKPPAGRMEIIAAKNGVNIVIDYAHEPASLEAVYKTLTDARIKKQGTKLICLLGAQGGGRDKWKRAAMGKIASEYCNQIILTNEDPYDEPPENIINDVAAGASQVSDSKSEVLKIIDRKEAIRKAISLAGKNDFVILTGKGGEVWMCVENNKKIAWDERKIIEEIINTKSGPR